MPKAAFFDLDGTLLTVNSGRLWMQRERREGRITAWQQAQAMFYLLGCRFGLIDIHRTMRKALQTIKGLPEQTVREWTEDWYEAEVKPLAAPGAWPVLDWVRESTAGEPRLRTLLGCFSGIPKG